MLSIRGGGTGNKKLEAGDSNLTTPDFGLSISYRRLGVFARLGRLPLAKVSCDNRTCRNLQLQIFNMSFLINTGTVVPTRKRTRA